MKNCHLTEILLASTVSVLTVDEVNILHAEEAADAARYYKIVQQSEPAPPERPASLSVEKSE